MIPLNIAAQPVTNNSHHDPCDAQLGVDRARIDLERPLEFPHGFLLVFWETRSVKQSPGAHDTVARIWIGRLFLVNPAACVAQKFKIERSRETSDDLTLRLRDIAAIGVEPVGLSMGAALRLDQLSIDLNPVAQPPYTAFEDIVDAELAADLPHVNGFALVGEGSGAGDYKATGNPREVTSQVIGDPVSEIFLVRFVRSTGS